MRSLEELKSRLYSTTYTFTPPLVLSNQDNFDPYRVWLDFFNKSSWYVFPGCRAIRLHIRGVAGFNVHARMTRPPDVIVCSLTSLANNVFKSDCSALQLSMFRINRILVRPPLRLVSNLTSLAPRKLYPSSRQSLRFYSSDPARNTNMESNNADFQLGNLFDVKNKVALVTGGGTLTVLCLPELSVSTDTQT